jgi:hypothetical protein
LARTKTPARPQATPASRATEGYGSIWIESKMSRTSAISLADADG